MHRHECNTLNFLFKLENKKKDFSYTIFLVKKNKCWKSFKIMGKSLFNCFHYSHPEIGNFRVWQIYPPLNGISSQDSKKEEARRREINKNIAIEVGRWSFSFVDRCETFNLFLRWLLEPSSEWTKKQAQGGKEVRVMSYFLYLASALTSFW
jgi:hypothetical protein